MSPFVYIALGTLLLSCVTAVSVHSRGVDKMRRHNVERRGEITFTLVMAGLFLLVVGTMFVVVREVLSMTGA